MKQKKLSRRKRLAGAAGVTAATMLHSPAGAAGSSWKYGDVPPITHPTDAQIPEFAPKIKGPTGEQFEYAVHASSATFSQTISGALV